MAGPLSPGDQARYLPHDKTSRTEEETEAMLHCCHASFHHWTRVADATPTNRAVGYWQLSRVYAVAGMPAEAERYARRCEEAARAVAAEETDTETRDVLLADIESVPSAQA
jgi:hypothetical protein